MARAGSISRASTILNIAQPALSRQLIKLEEEIGVSLLLRHGRGVRLTRAGSSLLEHANAVLRQVDQISELVRAPQTSFAGHVVFGLPPAAGLVIGPVVVEMLRERWPHASIHVREGISSSLEEWLLDRRLDLAVLYNPPPLDGIMLTPIVHERMVAAGPISKGGGTGEGNGRAIRWRDLSALPLILPSLPHSNRRMIEQAAIQRGARLNVVLEVDSVSMTKAMVQRGLGWTILAHAAVAGEAARGEMQVRIIDRPPLISTVAIGMPRERQSAGPADELFKDELLTVVRDVIRERVAAGAWFGATMVDDYIR